MVVCNSNQMKIDIKNILNVSTPILITNIIITLFKEEMLGNFAWKNIFGGIGITLGNIYLRENVQKKKKDLNQRVKIGVQIIEISSFIYGINCIAINIFKLFKHAIGNQYSLRF